ncbi:4a-hydroxytetrahydrobiopterin dehydratase [Gilvibacter sediminis]|uniref:4a-hydroxytetrahydrobiopterin dehydratase n=1 Tax=Gilvibacter sediminis TaxID=379071 RepID=UPI0030100AA5
MKLSEDQIKKALQELPDWNYEDGFLKTQITCADFKEAFALMTRIAFEAEALNHHPNWDNVYNRINISLQTHDAGGITDYDLQLAQKINQLKG